MKAVIWTAYGPPNVLKFLEIPQPIPKENQILIKIRATTVTAGDCEMRSMQVSPWLRLALRIFIGLRKPTRIQILGQEMAGEVVDIGSRVKEYQVGDRVFGTLGLQMGGYAQYICRPEVPGEMDGVLAPVPDNLSWQEAAAVPVGGMEALHFLREAAIQPGDKVLIIGAGGSIGTYGIQLAKDDGGQVTGIDRSDKLDLMRSVGADRVIDYTLEDFSQEGSQYDVIFDVIGAAPFVDCWRSLTPSGRYCIVNPRFSDLLRTWLKSRNSNKKVIIGASTPTYDDLITLKDMIENGKLKPIIDQVFPLEEAAAAHRYHESGAKRGNLVLTVGHNQ